MFKLYMDEHVPAPVTYGLRLVGVDVITSVEDGADGIPDPLLLDRATGLGRILFTQDRDFLKIGAERQSEGKFFFGIVYAPQRRLATGRMIEDLELIVKATTLEDVNNRVRYLPI